MGRNPKTITTADSSKQTPTLKSPPRSNGKPDSSSEPLNPVKKRKNLKSIVASIRRSQRNKKSSDNKETERVVEEIDASESGNDELMPLPLDENKSPSDSSDEDDTRKETPTVEYPSQSPMVTSGGDNGKDDPPISEPLHPVKKRKNLKSIVATIRRSQRAKKSSDDKEGEWVVEEIDASESDNVKIVTLAVNKSPSDSSGPDDGRKEAPTLEYTLQSPMITSGGDNGKNDPISKALYPVKKKRKNLKKIGSMIRRSQRAKKTNENKEIEPVIEEIDASESEKEELVPLASNENKSLSYSSYEESEGNPSNVKYKSMYIRSQKKIQDLQDENRELRNNMELVIDRVTKIEKNQNNINEQVMTVIASLTKMNENLYAELKERASSSDATEVEVSRRGGKRPRSQLSRENS